MRQKPSANLLPSRSISAAIIIASMFAALGASDDGAREPVTRIVFQIQRADYQGDRGMLKHLYYELAPFLDKGVAVRVRYWRGFALWRSAINGFNDSVDPQGLEQDLKLALDEFKEASAKEPAFVEAKIGMVSCLGYLSYVNRQDAARAQELTGQITPLVTEAKGAAPDNPRLLWVLGPILWNTPPEGGGGQDKAMESYKKGLEFVRKNKPSADRLEPSWGEPELLMSLAWSNLNRTTPDLNAAEDNARAALKKVSYWHYVRDILLPQIVAAKAKIK